MNKWITPISRAAMMGLAWALAWLPFGVAGGRLLVGEVEPEHLAGPLFSGFLCGAMFTALTGMASGRRRLGDLSALRAAAWGAASGLFVGVLPFVLGDNGRYQAGWSTTIVAISFMVTGVAARRRLPELSSFRVATLVAVVTGLLSGVLPWILTNQNGIERFLPVALIAGLCVIGAVSALLSQSAARWVWRHDPEASTPTL
jgi:hypothetical protein